MHKVFGIRHHGPGSARRLKNALESWEPDLILIEGPAEADQLVSFLSEPDLEPPVAVLVYDPKEPKIASFYPFAAFSPEWVAMEYASQNALPVRFIDLSPGQYWPTTESSVPRSGPHPLQLIAQLAGYPSGEKWWDEVVESLPEEEDHFAALLELMREARIHAELSQASDPRTLRREAMMRKQIRAALKGGYQRIAVVCGAYHAPVLDKLGPAKNDNALLKGMKRRKMLATWIPWTYERLAFESGYGAGVLSPSWYELMYAYPESEWGQRWLSQAAVYFREEGLHVSSAQVIDAVQLAQNLALLRGRKQASLGDLQESLISVFDQGSEERLQWVHERLIIGQKRGSIPASSPTFPLQKDIQLQQKSLRLKVLAEAKEIILDLRKEFDQRKSHFLHRLRIIDIDWGETQVVSKHEGTFREIWKLEWRPECELQIVAAASWGNTVQQAAENRLNQGLQETQTIAELAASLEKVFLADLRALFPILIQKLSEQSSLSRAVAPLLEIVPPLVNIYRYGNVREHQEFEIDHLIKGLVPRLCIGLEDACRQLDDELAETRFSQVQNVHASLALLGSMEDEEIAALWQQWLQQLASIVRQSRVHPKISGYLLRILFDNQSMEVKEVEVLMNQMLSVGVAHQQSAQWIEGLLSGSGLLLIHYPPLFHLLDRWLEGLRETDFDLHLPLLRRTFARFSTAERRQMGQMAAGTEILTKQTGPQGINQERAEQVRPIFEKLLGIGKD